MDEWMDRYIDRLDKLDQQWLVYVFNTKIILLALVR